MIKSSLEDMFEPTKEHWIIKSEKKQAIWQKPYLSYQEAKTEFDLQYSRLSMDDKIKSDWKIKHVNRDYRKMEEPKQLPETPKLLIDPLPNF